MITVLLGYTLAGLVAALIAGYLCGAVGGLMLTAYNNLLPDAPNGAYLPMAYLLGNIGAKLAILPGAAGGLLLYLLRLSAFEFNKES